MSELLQWTLRTEIRQLEELNKMLQVNMYHYEYRCRDSIIKEMKLEDDLEKANLLITELKAKLVTLEQPK